MAATKLSVPALSGLAVAAAVIACGWIYLASSSAPSGAVEAVMPNVPIVPLYDSRPLGEPAEGRPMITHVMIVDLDQDGLPDVLAADAQSNSVRWLRQFPRGVFTERTIGEVAGPAHVAVCDLNGTGRLDVLVAGMGMILPNNDQIGSVVVFENLGDGSFVRHTLLERVARVTDVRGANLSGHADGRLDLVVGQFGYVQGEIRWMKNLGNWQFQNHPLLNAPGTIHTPVADFDGDGRPDFAALVSQDAEETHLFLNRGDGVFHDQVLWKSPDPAWASSGLDVADINRDGRPDLIYSNGDGFDGLVSTPPWHGLQWLENNDGRSFTYRRIGNLPGCYSPVAADLNGDGYTDIVAVSCFNNWKNPAAVSLMAWMNDGKKNFTPVALAHEPIQLVTVAAGDLDGDGIPELITGGFHIYTPEHGVSRLTLWHRRK